MIIAKPLFNPGLRSLGIGVGVEAGSLGSSMPVAFHARRLAIKKGDISWALRARDAFTAAAESLSNLGVETCIVVVHATELRLYETMRRHVSEESNGDFGR
jgi:hypothetical protein